MTPWRTARSGDRAPIVPIARSETMAASLPPRPVRFERFENCGHAAQRDDPERAFRVLREFVLG